MSNPSLFVMRAGAIGDFILTLPALSALRQKYPTRRLILAARADVLPLVKGTLADEVIPVDSALLTPLFLSGGEFSEALQTRLAEVDLAVVWLSGNAARTVSDNLRRLDVGRLLSADPLPNRQHVADHLLATLAPLGIGAWEAAATPFVPASLPPPTWLWQDRQVAVLLHIGSGGAHKRWPLDRFLALAERLAVLDGGHVALLTGPAEESGFTLANPSISHIVPPDLSALASILKGSRLYLGNDSGPTHLAAAVGTPTIALFGPTDPAVWGPRGPHVTVIQSAGGRMEGISIETVFEQVLRGLPVRNAL